MDLPKFSAPHGKILLTLFIAFKAHAPLLKAVQHTFAPEK